MYTEQTYFEFDGRERFQTVPYKGFRGPCACPFTRSPVLRPFLHHVHDRLSDEGERRN